MSLKQILQKAVIYPVIISQLFLGAYRCGNDVEPNPEQDAQVQVDTGHDKDVGLEDKLVYPDANGDNEKPDTGYDANLTDTYDGGVDASDVDIADTYNPDGGDVILTDTYIQPDGGDVDVSDGGDAGQGIPPIVIIETKDEQGNVKSEFNVDEIIIYDLNKSYDPDCGEAGTCGLSKGMDYCDWETTSQKSKLYFLPKGNGTEKYWYTLPSQNEIFKVKCYDLDDGLFTESQISVKIN